RQARIRNLQPQTLTMDSGLPRCARAPESQRRDSPSRPEFTAGRCPRLRSLSAFPATPPLLYHHDQQQHREGSAHDHGGAPCRQRRGDAVARGGADRRAGTLARRDQAGHINPFEGIRREDAEQIVAALTSLDRDHWAAAWCKVGLGYDQKGDARAKAGAPGKDLAELYTLAFEYCHIARYPVPSSPGKEEAYRHSLRLFRKAAQHYAPPLAIIEIPFEGKSLVGYLQIPPDVARPPVVMHWGGVDGWKENRQRPSAAFHRAGIATLTVDMPGTGENPVRYGDASAERTFSAWLDHLAARRDVDGSRVGVWGGSFGAYWAARLAFTEAKRIKGAV